MPVDRHTHAQTDIVGLPSNVAGEASARIAADIAVQAAAAADATTKANAAQAASDPLGSASAAVADRYAKAGGPIGTDPGGAQLVRIGGDAAFEHALWNAAEYDDWRWGGQGVNPPGAPADAVLTEVTTDRWQWVWSNNSTMAFPDQQINHDYKEGTDIQPHIHFTPTVTGTHTGTWTAVFTLWKSGAQGEVVEAPLTLTAAFNGAMTAGVEQVLNFNSVIPGAGRKISSNGTITLKLALTAGAGLALLGFDGHYAKDTIGSKTQTVK